MVDHTPHLPTGPGDERPGLSRLDTIVQGNALDVLRELESESVNCVVTSPPYWQQRNYHCEGQIGLEKSPREYVERLASIFSEVYRLLKSDGVCWLNIGDKYISAKGTAHNPGGRVGPNECFHSAHKDADAVPLWWPNKSDLEGIGIKNKELAGIPWMLAFALRDNGWYIRSDVIWHKTAPMPESVEDRPTRSHEHIFLLTKAETYYYDQDAVREPLKPSSVLRLTEPGLESQMGSERGNGGAKANGPMKACFGGSRKSKINDQTRLASGNEWVQPIERGANLRDVWSFAPAGFKEAHFATFPTELAERCIKAGCPEGGIVLDPFMGAGTVALVAKKLQRNYIGIELNQEYVEMAEKRIERECGGLL